MPCRSARQRGGPLVRLQGGTQRFRKVDIACLKARGIAVRDIGGEHLLARTSYGEGALVKPEQLV
jgi:hypothetical protein